MSKWFEVELQTLVVYAIEVKDDESEQAAIDVALTDWTLYGRTTATALPVPSTHLPMIRKNAHMVRTLDPHFDEDGGLDRDNS